MTYLPITTNFQSHFYQNDCPVDIIKATPSHAQLKAGKNRRKQTLAIISFALIVALVCIALVIGTSASQAAGLPVFTAANALAAKQDAGIAGMATASLTIIAFAALAIFSTKR